MCDLVPFRNLHRTSRYVSWTLHSPAAHHLLVCPYHPSHHLTPDSKRSFSPALSLNCQTSHFQLLISFFWASHLSLPCTICSENSDPHCSKQTTQGWMWLWHTLLSCSPHLQGTGGTSSLSSGPGPLYAQRCTNTGQNISPDPPTIHLEGSTHNNAVPHHTWYYL